MRKILAPLLLLIILSMTSIVQAEPTKKDLEKVIRGMIDALNTTDIEKREAFLKAYYVNADSASARERWQGHLRRYSEMLGNVRIESVDVSNPAEIHVTLFSDAPRVFNEYIDFYLNMDVNKPDKYFSMGMHPALNPEIKKINRTLTDDEIKDYITKYIDKLVAKDLFSGTISLVKNGETLLEGAYGKADLRWDIPNKLDTKFNLGSMNKMFTGVAICQLVEQGKLSFDDPMSKYITDYPDKEAADKIKIHHLLTHTSGMGSYWNAMAQMDWTKLRSVKDFADLTKDDSLLFEPGESFQYSNSGPLYLGLIIEKITGMDYHDYIHKNVSGPAGMINTDCYNVDAVIPNLAQGYFWNDETNSHWANIFEHSARGSAAGGGFSTVFDLQNFAKALYDGTLLSKEMLQTYTTGKIDMGPGDKYAYLIGDSDWNGHRAVGHGGGAPGINSDLKIFPDIGYTIAVMSNYDEAANAVSNMLSELIIHNRPVPN